MKSNVFFILFSIIPFLCFADEHRISLAEENFEFGQSGLDFFIEKIIDAREEKFCLGFVRKGMMNNKVPAFFKEGFEEELMTFFSRTMNKSGEAIVLKINHLFVYEVGNQDIEISVAELNVSFLKKEGEEFIELLETGTVSDYVGLEVTRKHAGNITDAFRQCFTEFKLKKDSGKLMDVKNTGSETELLSLKNKKYNIEKSVELKGGFYPYFNDFRENEPIKNGAYTVEYHYDEKKEVAYAELDWLTGVPKEQKLIWGFSDGKDCYVRVLHNYYKINTTGDIFTVRAPKIKSGATTGAAIGGLLGAFIGSGILSESNSYEDYKLDFMTGALLPLDEPMYRKIESRLMICASQYNDEVALSVKIDGEKKCDISPAQYQTIIFSPSISEVELCVESDGGISCEKIELELFQTKLYLVSTKKRKPPKIDSPTLNLRADIVSDIKKGKFEEACTD